MAEKAKETVGKGVKLVGEGAGKGVEYAGKAAEKIIHLFRPDKKLQADDLYGMMVSTAYIQYQWEELGELLGVPRSELANISSEYPTSIARCHYEMMRYWIKNNDESCWEELVHTLKVPQVNQVKLAEKIDKDYIQDKCGSKFIPQNYAKQEKIRKVDDFWNDDASAKAVAKVDWRVLGLMLGLKNKILKRIQKEKTDEEERQKSMVEEWIKKGHPYWSVLIEALRGPVLREAELADLIAEKHLNQHKPPMTADNLLGVIVSTADIQHQWKKLGQALGVPPSELDKISSEKSITRCHYEMMKYWITNVGGSWEGLVNTLKLPYIKQEKLAEMIGKEYIKGEKASSSTPLDCEKQGLMSKGGDWHEVFAKVDWKVLGLLLGLSADILEFVQEFSSSEEDCQQSVMERWISTKNAYWSVLMEALGGPVLREAELADKIAEEHLSQFKSKDDLIAGVFACQHEEVEKMKEHIQDTLVAFAEKGSQPKGIAFVFGMTGVQGSDTDVDRVTKTFRKDLEFAVLRNENIDGQEIVNLIKAAATFDAYPKRCRERRVFYFSGHGGIDKHQRPFFKPMLDKEDQVFYIRENILSHFKSLKPEEGTFMFFFDCCLSPVKDNATNTQDEQPPSDGGHFILDTPVQCLVAYATSTGLRSWGDSEEGGLWTSSLCDHLVQPPEELSLTLGKVHLDVMEKSNNQQPPHMTSCAGPIYLKGVRCKVPSNDYESPNVLRRNGHEIFWGLFSSPQLTICLATLLSYESVIGKEVEKDVRRAHRREDAINLLFEELKKKTDSSSWLMGNIFRSMKHFEELVALADKMEKESVKA